MMRVAATTQQTRFFWIERLVQAHGAIQASRVRRGGLPAQTVALLRGTDAPASLCLI